jgi:pimeloyl-ACP methyl ester carboxylesterase
MPHSPLDAQATSQGLHAVSVPTVRGRQLHAWWWPQAQVGKGACAVLMHGWGGNASNLMSAAQHLHAQGWHVLLPDARGHGLSDGDDYSSLPRFAEDIDAALAWLATQVPTDSGTPADRLLMGHSLGAAACILSASRRRDVNAVVSISAFAHPEQVMRRWLANYHLPFWPLGWGVNRYIEHVIGHRFNDIAPLSRLPHVRCPVLLVHGQSDNIVPMHCAQLLMDSQPLAQLMPVAGTHEVFEDQARLERDVLRWINTQALN